MWLPDRWPCIHSLKTTFFQTNRPSKETVALSVLSQLSWCIRARETYDCMHNKFFLTPQLQTSDVQPNSSIIAEAPSSRSLPGKLLRGRWGLRVPLLTHYVMCQLPSLLLFRAHTVLHGGFFWFPNFCQRLGCLYAAITERRACEALTRRSTHRQSSGAVSGRAALGGWTGGIVVLHCLSGQDQHSLQTNSFSPASPCAHGYVLTSTTLRKVGNVLAERSVYPV